MMLKANSITKNNFTVKSMTSDYINDVYKIEKECFSEPWSEKCIKDTINNKNSYFIVAALGTNIIGYAGMYFIGNEGYMYNIAVKKEYRKFGIGSALLAQLEKYSNYINLKFLSLEVRETNSDAICLYKKFDFMEVGKRKSFYKLPEEDAIIMTKYFKNNGDAILYENTCNRDVM